MIGLVATVMVVVPTLGPLIGGLLDTGFGWESIFIFTAMTERWSVGWAAITLPETRGLNAPQGAREGFLRDLARLARSAQFAGYVLRRRVRLGDLLCVPRRRRRTSSSR